MDFKQRQSRNSQKKIEALFALSSVDHSELNAVGRPFTCEKCLKDPSSKKPRESIARIRRCYEDRWDFDIGDGSAFPIQMTTGGPQFGFCPAKVTRDDPESMMIFQTLTAILETNTWPRAGGLEDQEDFWVELVSLFGPFRRQMEFNEKFNLIAQSLGGGSKSSPSFPKAPKKPNPGTGAKHGYRKN